MICHCKKKGQFMEKTHFCRKLSAGEIVRIYSTIAPLHFPKAELKPIENVKKYLEQGLYIGYGFFENETLLAYALFFLVPKERKLLLDYYAVLEKYRNDGIGSAFLLSLRTTLSCADGIYIESEDPDFAKTGQEKEIREKRIAFYQRNDAAFTGILSTLFDVPYRILYLPLLKDEKQNTASDRIPDFYQDINVIYHTMFSPNVYAKNIILKSCH